MGTRGSNKFLNQEKRSHCIVRSISSKLPRMFLWVQFQMQLKIYEKYKDEGVRVLGLATAFEDFDKNNLDNLKMLLETGEVVGETKSALAQYGQLQEGSKLSFKNSIPGRNG